MSFGADLTATLWGIIGSLPAGSCVDLLGVKVILLHSMQITSTWVECWGVL